MFDFNGIGITSQNFENSYDLVMFMILYDDWNEVMLMDEWSCLEVYWTQFCAIGREKNSECRKKE